MRNRTYKDAGLQALYNAFRAWGSDTASTLYREGKPRRGADHRAAYWNGRSNVAHRYVSGSQCAIAFAAGKDDARDFGAAVTTLVNFYPITRFPEGA